MLATLAIFCVLSVSTTELVQISLYGTDNDYSVNFRASPYGSVIYIGTPPQILSVTFDTSTANLWVDSSNCTSFTCTGRPRYDSSQSSTYEPNGQPFSSQGVYGYISGFLASDTVTIGDVEVKNQTFAEITSESDLISVGFLWAGVVGLAFESVSSSKTKPLFFQMIDQGLIAEPVFSFYFNRNTSAYPAGELMLGGSDPDHYEGDLTYVPLSKPGYWQFLMDSIEVENNTFCSNSCQAIINTGISLITGPSEEVEQLHEVLGVELDDFGLYSINCSLIQSFPNIDFIIDGSSYTLTAEDYILQGFYGCLSGFAPNDDSSPDESLWNIGDNFIRKFYTVFDAGNNRLGFAEAK